ncbi:MAG: Abi family protein [Firmicutes bacterium]|nr:Abi family protein [Bacillota bacterium]
MKNKTFKTLDEQIEILKNKGLIINDVDKAKEILFRENYFFISGYRSLFMKDFNDRKFINGTTFEELYAMFVFDRNIRNIMFKNILIVENNIKSIISYQLSKKYGFKEKDYLNVKNFSQDSMKVRQVKDVLNKMKRQIKVNVKHHSATAHYLSNYGYIPLWILVKVLSFGIISELYCILKPDDQFQIADIYNLDVHTLEIYLSLLSNFRNLCAHEDILFNHRTQRRIPDDLVHSYLEIESNEDGYLYGKNDLFAIVIIFKYMLSQNEYHDLINEINYEISLLDGKIDVVPLSTLLNKIGFPENWIDILNVN